MAETDASRVNWQNPYADRAGTWCRGDLHVHSDRSGDAQLSEEVLFRQYELQGYRFIALTDHNLISLGSHPPTTLIVYEGIEVDFHYPHHTNIIHPRADRIRYQPDWDQERLLRENAESGCLVILNHPNWEATGHYTADYLLHMPCYDGIEIYNSGTEGLPGSPLSTDIWDRLLSEGKRVLGFANQDVHIMAHLKRCGNFARAAGGSAGEIFRALKAGNFYCYYGVEIIDLGRRGRSVWVKCRDAANIRFVGKAGQTILETRGDSAEIVFLDDERYDYIRVECYGDHGRKSWTQPFFRD